MGLDPGCPLRRSLLALYLLWAIGCAHGGSPDLAILSSNSDELIWQAGQKALAKHQYESARQHFKRIIDGFPQSEYSAEARLALADTHSQEGGTANEILAVSEYRDFLSLYPSHPKGDYAQFQLGECYYRQRNGPDRDQTSTQKALDEYARLVDIFSTSPYVEKGRARIMELRQTLARAEFQTGYFYQRTRRACRAAIARYEGILTDFPDYREMDQVLFRLGECLSLSGRGAEALPQLRRLVDEFPQSHFADPARRLMDRIGQSPQAPPAPPPIPATPKPSSPDKPRP